VAKPRAQLDHWTKWVVTSKRPINHVGPAHPIDHDSRTRSWANPKVLLQKKCLNQRLCVRGAAAHRAPEREDCDSSRTTLLSMALDVLCLHTPLPLLFLS